MAMDAASKEINFESLVPPLELNTRDELCEWLSKIITTLQTSFKDSKDIGKIKPKSLDAFIGNLLMYMEERSIYSKGFLDEIQQGGITIVTHLLQRDDGKLSGVLKAYNWLLMDSLIDVLCKNLKSHNGRGVNEVTFELTCNALADLCNITGVKKRLCSFLERQHSNEDSLKDYLTRSLNTPKEKDPAEILLKALGLLESFQARNNVSKLDNIISAYKTVIQHQEGLQEGVQEQPRLSRRKFIGDLACCLGEVQKEYKEQSKKARTEVPEQ